MKNVGCMFLDCLKGDLSLSYFVIVTISYAILYIMTIRASLRLFSRLCQFKRWNTSLQLCVGSFHVNRFHLYSRNSSQNIHFHLSSYIAHSHIFCCKCCASLVVFIAMYTIVSSANSCMVMIRPTGISFI